MRSRSFLLLQGARVRDNLFRMANSQTRLWLIFPPKLITRPILWELSKEFSVVTNIRQASVTDEVGIVSLSLEGEADEIRGRSHGWKGWGSRLTQWSSTRSRVRRLKVLQRGKLLLAGGFVVPPEGSAIFSHFSDCSPISRARHSAQYCEVYLPSFVLR